MFVNRSIAVISLVCVLIIPSCVREPAPTVLPDPTATPIQPQSTSEVFIGIPPLRDPLVQFENETVEEFVARIAVRDISYSRPVLIVLSQLEIRGNVLYGVPSGRQDVRQCWFYETRSKRECTSEDLERFFQERAIAAIFFAFVYSDGVKSFFLAEHYYSGDETNFIEYYRVILENRDSTWIEKNILPLYW